MALSGESPKKWNLFCCLGLKEINIETKKRKSGLPITLFIVALVIVLAKPLIIDFILPLSGGHGGGLSGDLSKANFAENISGSCDIVAAILALLGGFVLMRSLFKK